MIASSFALGSNVSYIYIRGEYVHVVKVVEKAIVAMRFASTPRAAILPAIRCPIATLSAARRIEISRNQLRPALIGPRTGKPAATATSG